MFSFVAFREGMFAVFYIMTEQNRNTRPTGWGTFRCFFLYIIDAGQATPNLFVGTAAAGVSHGLTRTRAGQMFRALLVTELNWSPSIVSLANKFDFFACVMDVVSNILYWFQGEFEALTAWCTADSAPLHFQWCLLPHCCCPGRSRVH